jgi:hypothetical protein
MYWIKRGRGLITGEWNQLLYFSIVSEIGRLPLALAILHTSLALTSKHFLLLSSPYSHHVRYPPGSKNHPSSDSDLESLIKHPRQIIKYDSPRSTKYLAMRPYTVYVPPYERRLKECY